MFSFYSIEVTSPIGHKNRLLQIVIAIYCAIVTGVCHVPFVLFLVFVIICTFLSVRNLLCVSFEVELHKVFTFFSVCLALILSYTTTLLSPVHGDVKTHLPVLLSVEKL